jgi:hypothetical protein
MKLINQYSLIALVVLLFSSCAKVFYSTDAYTLARNQGDFAIVPPIVSIETKSKFDADAMKEQQKTESFNFQNEMYSWMLKRKMQGKIKQEIQVIETTNAILCRAGYPEIPLSNAELCDLLEVDGILTSNYSLSKPMSEGAAIAAILLIGMWGNTNEVQVSLSLNDCRNTKLIWNYNHKYSGGVGSSTTRLVDELMRDASEKMPY